MRSLLFVLAILLLCYGLWAHDWTTIGASVGLLLVWPALAADLKREANRESERIWEAIQDPATWDHDLSDSA